MALSALVKVSGVTNLSDARFCAGVGVGILGFCPEQEHPDYVDLKKYKEITSWIQGVKITGEFYSSDAERILHIDTAYAFDYLQVNDVELVNTLFKFGKPLIFKIDLFENLNQNTIRDKMGYLSDKVAYYLIEGRSSDQDLVEAVGQWSFEYPVLMGFGNDTATVTLLLKKYKFSGLAFRSGKEIRPGYGDFTELADIFEALETGN
jgi:phosphoribosylanthranilate isomerase